MPSTTERDDREGCRNRFRVAYVVSHPIQYQAPLLRYLASRNEFDLHVYYLRDFSAQTYHDPGFQCDVRWDVDLCAGYSHEFVPTGTMGWTRGWGTTSRGFWTTQLRPERYDAVWLHGYRDPALLGAWWAARRAGLKVLIRGETGRNSTPSTTWRRRGKDSLLRRLFRGADGFLAIGSRNRRFYLDQQVPQDRVHWMPYAVDNRFFRESALSFSSRGQAFFRKWNLDPHRPRILFASKLSEHKGAHDLLDAYRMLSPDGVEEPHAQLVLVGEGADRRRLEQRAHELGWRSILFAGFQNQSSLPDFYAMATVFVLPSKEEPWGLVVNEAMNAGCPVVVTEAVGAGEDLVEHGVNGFRVPDQAPESLADAIRRILDDESLAQRMGEESRKRVEAFSFEEDHRGLRHALATVVGS